MFDDVSVIIPVREGSSRIKDKIFLPFANGMNLLEWKIYQLKKVQDAQKIFISSNSENVKKTAEEMGVRFLKRNDYLSTGHVASFSEVITGIVNDIETEHFAWVTVVVPLMTPSEYRSAFESYIKNCVDTQEFDSLVSVNLLKDYFWMNGKPLNYQANKDHTISQNLPDLFRVTNGLYMSDKKSTLERGYFLGKNPFMHKVSKISGVDIDEYEDYQISKSLFEVYSDK